MAHAGDEQQGRRLAWLVGTARRWWGGEAPGIEATASAAHGADRPSLWSALSRAAAGGCPYLSGSSESARIPSAGGEMRCPFAAAGQTELPPGHPMIPGMLAKRTDALAAPVTAAPAAAANADGAAAKLLTVAQSVSVTGAAGGGVDRDAAMIVLQAAARGMLARQASEGQRHGAVVPPTGAASSIVPAVPLTSLRQLGPAAARLSSVDAATRHPMHAAATHARELDVD
jgi:hypothetical protein